MSVPAAERDAWGHVLSIGQLAAATGMTVSALRAWESRYGFPTPHRPKGGGHRRYSGRDVAVIQEVLRRQQAGARLGVAIEEARQELPSGVTLSVFTEIVEAFPDLPRTVLDRERTLTLSLAIEDEVLDQAPGGHLFGGFQSLRHFSFARTRWTRLAQVVETAHAFAQAEEQEPGPGTEGAEVVLVSPEAPLNREWIVLYDGPVVSVALLGLEQPGQEALPDAELTFEVAWTIDPEVVRAAARRCAAAASASGSVRATELLAGPLAGRRSQPPERYAVDRLVQRIAGLEPRR